MVPPEQEEILRIFDFVGEQQTDCLQRLFTAINVVAQEQVVRFGREATVFEEPKKVRVLAVDVAANLKRRLQLQQDWLLQEDLPGFETESADFRLGHLDRFARSTSSD